MNMIEWLQQEEFQRRFDENYRSKNIYLIDSLELAVSFSELSNILPVALFSHINEEDGLGFRNIGFGCVGDLLFTITCLPNKFTYICLRGKDDETEKYQWSFLEKLVDLPTQILRRISWIRSDFSADRDFKGEAKSAIFFKSNHGVVFQIYKAVSEVDTQELLSFLNGLKCEYDYWVDKPEPTKQTWIITRSSRKEVDKIVGRYTQRSFTEEAARLMSERANAFFRVNEENTGQTGLTFFEGKISERY